MDNTEITELSNILFAALDTLMAIHAEIEQVENEIEIKTMLPMTNATMHWRPDSKGERTILELLHPTGSEYEQRTGRRREYIGKDPEAIQEAREAKKRYREFQELVSRKKQLEFNGDDLERRIMIVSDCSVQVKRELWGQGHLAATNLASPIQKWGHQVKAHNDQVSPNNGDGDRNGLQKATGTKEMSPGDSLQAVPILSTEKMSPNDVVNYFNNSDELRDLVPDLPKSFFS